MTCGDNSVQNSYPKEEYKTGAQQSEVGSGAIEEWASSADSPIGFTISIYMKNNYSIICM